MDDIAKIRKALGLSQQGVANKSTVTRSVIGEVEGKRKGLSVNAAVKAAPVLGVGPGVLYLGTQLVAIKAKVEEEEITEEVAADKLLRVLRTLLTAFEDVEEEEGADQLIDELEALLAEYTGNAVSTARGGKGVATKSRRGYHPAFEVAFKAAGTGQVRPEDYHVDDDRDLHGKALNSGRLRDDEEHGFPDVGAFGLANEPMDDEDDYPTDAEPDGRNIYGQRTRPLDGRR